MDFENVYTTYYQPIKLFLIKMVGNEWAAEDLVQETFIKVQKNLDDLKDETKLKSWVYSIARNLCLDYFRRKQTRARYLEQTAGEQKMVLPLVQLKIQQEEMSSCVRDKIYKLPETLREVIVLFETMELSQTEAAEVLGISVGNFKVRLHRARKALKDIFERECSFEQDERAVMVCEPKQDHVA